MAVPISTILGRKGADVTTVRVDKTLADAARLLTEHNIGAVVVTRDDGRVVGILSERDIVRRIADEGADSLTLRIEQAMTTDVETCASDADSEELMTVMTERRIRHLPVVDDEQLVGIVSIGDIVKSRIDQLALQAEALEAYVSGSSY